MDRTKTMGLVCLCLMTVLCSSCGNVISNVNTDEVREYETLTASDTVTAPVESEMQTQTSAETVTSPVEETTTTSAEKQTTKVMTTTTENIAEKPSTIVLGMDDSSKNTAKQTQQTESTQASITSQSTAETAKDDGYDHDQPMGNEVLPQSVDYYATETQAAETKPTEVPDTQKLPDPDETSSQTENSETVGYTSKGYTIEVKDGVTYVGGVIIANKSYELPDNYGNGLDNEALQAFYEMQNAASKDGIWLSIVSGYRSYWYQDQLYWGYVATRGGQAEADRFSARAGHSEHQTGLAMDLNNASRSFVGTPEAKWIEEHCVDYGFIIRYPDGKEDVTGFMYEPWHIRYLGTDMARTIADSGLTLEEYFGIDSKYSEDETAE